MNLRLLSILILLFVSSANLVGQCVGTQGQVSWHFWRGIDRDELAYLHVDDTYPLGPDGARILNSVAAPYKYDDDFGSMIIGFLSVPESGNVTFNLTGDDETVFLLSTDATAA